MNTSEQINELAAALSKAQGEMKNANLNKVNPHYKSRYADLAEIRDTVTPALSANGLAIVHGVGAMGEGLAVITRIVHTSGQWIESQFPIAYDKPQTMAGGITYGRRYNMSALCNIAADEDDDGNAANDAAKKSAPAGIPAAFLGGTYGASKAISRDNFNRIISAFRDAPSLKALNAIQHEMAADIERLPTDWFEELSNEYQGRKAELSKALAR